MELQTVYVLRRPTFGIVALGVASLFATIFLYFDEFYFVTPYLVGYIPPERTPLLVLDLAVSAMSGIVISLSTFQIRIIPSLRSASRKTGAMGILAAFVAGACPCYYLVPLLATTGGAGGILAGVGILFFDYEIPIKLGSLALLLFTAFAIERSLRAVCDVVPIRRQSS